MAAPAHTFGVTTPNTANAVEMVFALLTGVITAAPLLLFAGASQRTPLTIIGPMQYLVPTINFLLGWLAYGEPLDRPRVLGFAPHYATGARLNDQVHRRTCGQTALHPLRQHSIVLVKMQGFGSARVLLTFDAMAPLRSL